ncbi:bifunctional diguanylate cyclase/phosphodiesterase [Geobacillus sp. C56-T2]|uniref:putative bifunctional diguanylate cyclase/phosphodiesterase n=1 Tax=Geobacillus sp. C56-T2 TaxID=600773 RepID=UPI0011A4C72E|nr:EAL domain-containing protein [Geobacillus sp. C56-T2]NNV06242.1 EAL domain-containing protein [Geobacillus sp. MMMUD3]TWG30295.1 PAS domain S-box-containing protein/diguanylate cyclase (GGDEF)-like protein [Geobacillus sp. C56-T2]
MDKYTAFFHHFNEAVAILNGQGTMIYRNPAFAGLALSEEAEKALMAAGRGLAKRMKEQLAAFQVELSGGAFVAGLSPIIDERGQAAAILCVLRRQAQAEELRARLAEAERRLQLIVEHSNDYVFIFSRDRQLSYIPPSWKGKMNWQPASYDDMLAFVHPDDAPVITQKLANLYDTYETQTAEFRKRDEHGEWIWMEASGKAIIDEAGKLDCVIVTVKNISERKQYEEKLRQLAYFDSLTGIANRIYFERQIGELIASGTPFALCYLDFDKFKWINDHFSHQAGDYFLREAVKRVSRELRHDDFFARIGGDEFVLLLPNVTKTEMIALAERLVSSFHEPFYYEKQLIQSTLSIGIAFFPKDSDRIEQVMKYADQALYEVKERGRNGYAFYRPVEHRRIVIEQDLPFAIMRGQFYLCYQPKVRLTQGRAMGIEALLRWRHPTLGEIPPLDFIPLAEESGFIFEITLWVLERACCQVKEWERKFPGLKLAVNLSPFLLNRPELVEHVKRILRETELAPDRLILEVTESGLMENIETGRHILTELQQLGVQAAIDDFGTGFSSLAYIRNLPVSLLKIDRSFIQGIAENSKDATIVDTIIHLAKSLDIEVLAEGVETESQVALLSQMDCDYAQGFYFSRSLEAEKLQQWLEEYNRSAAFSHRKGEET